MKSYIKYILTIGLFSVIIAGASAQPLQSAYFLERAPLRHQLNLLHHTGIRKYLVQRQLRLELHDFYLPFRRR